jgi:glycosyltransferase involved in cell wall biosynthesis
MMGQVSDAVLTEQFDSVHCVVIPSRSESIPLVFSEALNFDREMIVTDVGDMGDLGREYHVARVVPPEDPLALKEAMKEKVRRDPGETGPGHEEKKADLKRRFDIQASVDRFLSDYQTENGG